MTGFSKDFCLFVCFSLKGWWSVEYCREQGSMLTALRRSYFQFLIFYLIQEEGTFPGFPAYWLREQKILTLPQKAGYQHDRNLVQTEQGRTRTPCSSGFALKVFIDLNFKAGPTNSHASICCPGGSAEDPPLPGALQLEQVAAESHKCLPENQSCSFTAQEPGLWDVQRHPS